MKKPKIRNPIREFILWYKYSCGARKFHIFGAIALILLLTSLVFVSKPIITGLTISEEIISENLTSEIISKEKINEEITSENLNNENINKIISEKEITKEKINEEIISENLTSENISKEINLTINENINENITETGTVSGMPENASHSLSIIEIISENVSEENITENLTENISEIITETGTVSGMPENASRSLSITENLTISENINENITETGTVSGMPENASHSLSIIEIINENISKIVPITEENIISEKLAQLPAEINKPVSWVKTVKVKNKDKGRWLGINIALPENIINAEVENKIAKTEKNKIEFNDSFGENEAKEYKIIYETAPPVVEEITINENRKQIIISSNISYENVLAYTDLPFEANERNIALYWIKNNSRELFTDINYIDTNNNGLIDRIEWTVPHLSEQVFELELTILNVQSYPAVKGNWTVMFTTVGMANLTISAVEGTEYGRDIEFLELRCNEQLISNQLTNSKVFVQDYSCNGTGYHKVKVLRPGEHTQEFRFGDIVKYAHNLASNINSVSITPNATQGYGNKIIITANVTDPDNDLNTTVVEIQKPDGTKTNYTMTNVSEIYTYNFTTWTNGTYTYKIYANDSTGTTSASSNGSFNYTSRFVLKIKTLKDSYSIERINLTDPQQISSFTNNTQINIPDNGCPSYIFSTVNIGAGGYVVSDGVDVFIDIDHTLANDLTVKLESPSGTNKTLCDQSCPGGTSSWEDTTYNDSTDFYSQNMTGTWKLWVCDHQAADTGTINLWRLNITHVENASGLKLTPYAEQSMLENSELTNATVYFNLIVQYFDGSTWVTSKVIKNDSLDITPRPINRTNMLGSVIGLDKIWNPISWNGSNSSYGPGTYRAYVEATDNESHMLIDSDGNNLTAYYNFTYGYLNMSLSIVTKNDEYYENETVNITAPLLSLNYTNSSSVTIRDANCPTADSSKISVTEQGNVSKEGMKLYVDIDHTLASDLILKLTSPKGTQHTLCNLNCPGGSGAWEDSGFANITAFALENITGTWSLDACDNSVQDTGTINSWQLNISYYSPTISVANKSWIKNNESSAHYLRYLATVEFYDQGSWIKEATIINDTNTSVLRTISQDSVIPLDLLWNEIGWNTSKNVHGGGKYRARIDIIDKNFNIFKNKTGGNLTGVYNFTLNAPELVLSVTLNYPANSSVQDEVNTSFSCSIGGNSLANVTLYTNFTGVFAENATMSLDGFSATSIFNMTMTNDGYYIWNCLAYEIDGDNTFAPGNFTFTFIKDINYPNISLDYPTNYSEVTNGLTFLNYSVNDSNLFSCSLYFNTSTGFVLNYTNTDVVNGSSNFTINIRSGDRYIWNVGCNDTNSNTAFAPENFTIMSDVTTPAVGIGFPGNYSYFVQGNYYFNFTLNETNPSSCRLYTNETGSFAASMTNSSPRNGTNSFTKNLTSGIYRWNVWCNDTNSNNAFSQDNFTLIINDLPVVALDKVINNSNITTGTLVLNCSSTDDIGLANISLYLNVSSHWEINQTRVVSGSSANANFTILSIPDGYYMWNCLAYDTIGNMSFAAANYTFNYSVDQIFPIVNLTSPSNGTQLNKGVIAFTYNLTEVHPHTCKLYFNQTTGFNVNSTAASPVNGENTFNIVVNEERDFVWNVGCNDTNANSVFDQKNFTLIVNNPPAVALLSPATDYKTALSSITFNCSATDTQGLANSSLYINFSGVWQINQTKNVEGLSNYSNYTVDGIVDGHYRWNCLFYDVRGLSNSSSNYSFIRDSIAPSWSNNQTNSTSGALNSIVSFSMTVSDYDAGLSYYIFSWNGTGTWDNATNGSISGSSSNLNAQKTILLTRGNTVGYRWHANDSVNNWNMSLLRTFSVINSIPSSCSIVYPLDGKNYTAIDINYTCSDVDGDELKYYVWINNSLNQSGISGNATNWQAADGYYSVKVHTDDSFSNSSNSSAVNFRLDTTPPGFNANETNATLVKINGNATFNITISDGAGLSYYIFSWNGTGNWDNLTNGTLSGNSQTLIVNKSTTLSRGNIVGYRWYANDSLNQWNKSLSSMFIVANTNPATPTILYPINGGNYTDIPINFSSADADNDSITYYIYINNTLNITTTTNITNWNGSDNAYGLNMTAYDNYDFSQNTTLVVFRIDTTAPIINLTYPANSSTLNNGTIAFNYSVNEYVSACSLYHNQSGFKVNLTNASAKIENNEFEVNMNIETDILWNVWCNDTVGNSGFADNNFTLRINNPPVVSLVSPINNSNLTINTTTFNCSATDTQGLANASLYINVSSTWQINQTKNITGTSNSTLFTLEDTPDGYYIWNCLFYDVRGLSNSSLHNYTFNLSKDLIAPIVNITQPANSSLGVNEGLILLNYTLTEVNPSTCILYLNNSGVLVANTTDTSPINGNNSFSITIGPFGYIWNIWCNDTNANSAWAANNFTFSATDISAPEITLNTPGNYSYVNTLTPSINCSAIDNRLLKNLSLYGNFTGSWAFYDYANVSGITSSNIFNVSGVSHNKTYLWNCLAYDASNNYAFASGNYTFTIDAVTPSLSLESPSNRSLYLNDTIIFKYNVADDFNLNCSLILNNAINQTSVNVNKSVSINFTLTNLGVSTFNWSINCTDVASNINGSEVRKAIRVIQTKHFDGRTTNLSSFNDFENITNLVIENTTAGMINFTEAINLTKGFNFDEAFIIRNNLIEINTTTYPEFSKAARLYLYNLTFTDPRILRNGSVCSAPDCTEVSYVGGNFTFDVARFTNYSAGETPAAPAVETPSAGGGGGGGGGGGRPIPECRSDINCKGGNVCVNEKCVILFDIKILKIDSPVESGEHLDFAYSLKNIEGKPNDVEVFYWLEDLNENKMVEGKEVAFMNRSQERVFKANLLLPENISGTHNLFVQMVYDSYTVKASKTVEIGYLTPLVFNATIIPINVKPFKYFTVAVEVWTNKDEVIPANVEFIIKKGESVLQRNINLFEINKTKHIEYLAVDLWPGSYKISVNLVYGETRASFSEDLIIHEYSIPVIVTTASFMVIILTATIVTIEVIKRIKRDIRSVKRRKKVKKIEKKAKETEGKVKKKKEKIDYSKFKPPKV